jgi:acetyl esterase/lipase
MIQMTSRKAAIRFREWLEGSIRSRNRRTVREPMTTPNRLYPFVTDPLTRRRFMGASTALAGFGVAAAKAITKPADFDTVAAPRPLPFVHEGRTCLLYAPDPKTRPADSPPVPLVFLFGGNGLGEVRRSSHAEQMALDLVLRGVAAAVVPYPALTARRVIDQSIAGAINAVCESAWPKNFVIDTGRLAAVGFSAGGLVAAMLATEYAAALPRPLLAAVNYFGPLDMRAWARFHRIRAEAGCSPNSVPFDMDDERQNKSSVSYRGTRGPDDMGHSATGPVMCGELSRSLLAKVGSNCGDLNRAMANYAIPELWNEGAGSAAHAGTPIVGVFGTLDDNCDALFHADLIARLSSRTGTPHVALTYEGPHGVSWRASRESMEILLGLLRGKSPESSSQASVS